MKLHSAFTTKYPGKMSVLQTRIGLSLPFEPKKDVGRKPPILTDCLAIWDTGATSSVITERFARKIGLEPSGKTEVTNTTGKQIRNTYLVNIYLPSKVVVPYLKITECGNVLGGSDVLIGMDVIGAGDFAVTSENERTVLSYVYPPIKTIDFVKEANSINKGKRKLVSIEVENKKRLVGLSKKKIRKSRKKERKNKKRGRKG